MKYKEKSVQLSIVVPIYNGEKTVAHCIESILNVDCIEYIEVLAIDDGSTDNTLAELQNFSDDIRIFSTNNRGVSAARNLGITNASGEYITFVDCDDVLIKGWIDIVRKAIETPSDLYIFNVYNESANHTVKMIKRDLGSGLNLKNDLIDYYWAMDFIPGVWDKIFRLDKILEENIRFPEKMGSGEDNLFVEKYLDHCSNYFISQQAYYVYRYNENSVSHLSLFKNYSDFSTVIERRIGKALYLDEEKRRGALNAIIRSFLNRFLWSFEYSDTEFCVDDYVQIEKKYAFLQYCRPSTFNQKVNVVLFKMILGRHVPQKIIAYLYAMKKKIVDKCRQVS